MFGIGGNVGQIAEESIAKIIARQQLEQEVARRAQMEQAQLALQQQRVQQDALEHADRMRGDTADREFRATSERTRSNQFGLEQMGRDREALDKDADQRALDELIAGMPEGAGRRVVNLRRRGVNVPAADIMTPEERAAEDTADITRAGKVAEAQARGAAKYRRPESSDYQKIETVDDAGNPMTNYMTPEEVRAKGGVRTSPKTTAKASGPSTVDAILGEIEGLSTKINTGGMGPQTTVRGLARRGAGQVNLDNDVAEYEALVKGFIPMVARAVGHTGVLTQQDVDSVRALFPLPGDNQQLAQNKLTRVRGLMQAMQPQPGNAPPSNGPVEYIRDANGKLVRKTK